jgi:hypothetical protein
MTGILKIKNGVPLQQRVAKKFNGRERQKATFL